MYKFLYIWYNITFWIKVARKHTPDILPQKARLDLYIQYMLYTYIPFQKIHRKDMESLSLPSLQPRASASGLQLKISFAVHVFFHRVLLILEPKEHD
jgi:hypothetical protein